MVQVGLPKWWEAGAQTYPIDNTTLAIIEVITFAFLEGKRYEGYKKTGAVRLRVCVCVGGWVGGGDGRRVSLKNKCHIRQQVLHLVRCNAAPSCCADVDHLHRLFSASFLFPADRRCLLLPL